MRTHPAAPQRFVHSHDVNVIAPTSLSRLRIVRKVSKGTARLFAKLREFLSSQ